MNQSYQFQRLQVLADHVKTLTKEKILQFFDKYVAASAPNRRKLCVQVFAKQHVEKMGDEVADNVLLVTDPAAFKRSMSLYPLPKEVDISVIDLPQV